jgi:tripartite-type tricarboxylate transporter receptor subunit TctC
MATSLTRRHWLALTPALLASRARAAAPDLRIIVPYAAGGPIDATTRLLAEKVRDTLGVVVVENRPGAGGNIGTEALAHAAPDGRTVGIAATATHAVNPWLFRHLPYRADRDFAALTQMVRVPNVLVMNAEVAAQWRIRTVQDLIAYARARPGQLSYGSGGNGSVGHLAGELFKTRAGVHAVHIPYNGAGPAQLALLGAQVQFNFDNLAAASANLRSSRLVALAVTTRQRSPLLPNVPALSETLQGFAMDTWWGLAAPAGTPAPMMERLYQAFGAALHDADTQSRYTQMMAEPAPSTPQEFAGFMRSELTRYEEIVRVSGAQVD